jgi:hypothetical protein
VTSFEGVLGPARPPSPDSSTPHLHHRFATNFVTTDQFYGDTVNGTLPTYSFIEANMWHGHNDMHPLFNTLMPGMDFAAPLITARWRGAGAHLQPDLRATLTLDRPRPPEDWPDVAAQPIPAFDQSLIPHGAPLSPMAQAFVSGSLALAKQTRPSVPRPWPEWDQIGVRRPAPR